MFIKELKFLSNKVDRSSASFVGGNMKQNFIAYLKDETGQTSTEYILLVAVVAAIVIKFKTAITSKLFGGEGGKGILNTVLDEGNFGTLSQ